MNEQQEQRSWTVRILGWPLRRRRPLKVLIALVLLFALPALWIAVVQRAVTPVEVTGDVPEGRYEVFAIAWGHHCGLIVEQPDGWRLGPPGDEDAPYIEYGWGDRSYYFESNYWPQQLVYTVALPSTPVMNVDYHDDSPVADYAEEKRIVRRVVNADELRRLISVAEGHFAERARGKRPEVLPGTDTKPGRFYPGKGNYTIWQNCNGWVVRALHDSGLSGSSWGVFSANDALDRIVETQGWEEVGIED